MNYQYPLDLTGTAPTNLVSNEQQVITEINGKFSQIIVPDYAPFYLDNLKLIHISEDSTETILNIDTDFFVGYPYQDLARETGKLTFGTLVVVNKNAKGRFKLSYQTIGDKWAADAQFVKNKLLELAYNPRIAYWDQLTNVQDKFPPQDHDHDITESDKWPALMAAIDRVTQAIADREYTESSIYPTVITFIESLLPPLLTKAAVGLPDVENYPTATQDDIDNLVSADKYVLLSQLLTIIQRTVDGTVSTDINALTQRINQLADELTRIEALIATGDQAVLLEVRAIENNVTNALSDFNTRIADIEFTFGVTEGRLNTLDSNTSSIASRVTNLENATPGIVTSNRPTPFTYFMSK